MYIKIHLMRFNGDHINKKLLVLSAIALALLCSVSVFDFEIQMTAKYDAEVEPVNYKGTQIDVYVTYQTRKGEIV